MAFNIKNFTRATSSGNSDAPAIFTYKSSTDTRGTIAAAGYFNEVREQFELQDTIFVEGSNGRAQFYINNLTPNVTMVLYEAPSNIGLAQDQILKGTANSYAVAGKLTGANVDDLAQDATTPGVPVVFAIDVDGGATADYDITIDYKVKVIDVHFYNTAAGDTSDSIQIKNGANAITDAMDASVSVNVIQRAAEIVDAQATISAGGTLRVTQTDNAGSDAAPAKVYVHAIRVA